MKTPIIPSTLYLYSYTKNSKVNKDRLYKLLSFYKEAKMYSSTINSYELFLLFLIARPLDEKFNEANNLRGFPGSFFRFAIQDMTQLFGMLKIFIFVRERNCL